MASNPLIAQGTLNRLLGSAVVTDTPALNVTASYLGKEGISLRLEGKASIPIPTMTGTVQSPEPYMMVTLTIALLKTQGLAAQFKAAMESNAVIGDMVITPDASTLPVYQLTNCAITEVGELKFNGSTADYGVVIEGYYLINDNLWNL